MFFFVINVSFNKKVVDIIIASDSEKLYKQIFTYKYKINK